MAQKIFWKVFGALVRNARYIEVLGTRQYARAVWGPPRSKTEICVNGVALTIRRGSRDLDVAIASLTQEFVGLRHLLPTDFKGALVDAGGYIGTAAIALSQLFPNAEVISIEPSLENLEILRKNTIGFPNIRVLHGALVAVPTAFVDLHDPGMKEWGYTTTREHSGTSASSMISRVPAFCLSDLGVALDEIGLLKLDIEGKEKEILSDAKDILERIPIVVCELHERFVVGCEKAFFDFSMDRAVFMDSGEKFISVRKA